VSYYFHERSEEDIMGIIGKIEKWMEDRKHKTTEKPARPFLKRRPGLMVQKIRCRSCGHNKMFYYNGIYKCCKCKEEINL